MKWLLRIWRAKGELIELIEATKEALEDKTVSAKEARELSLQLINTLEKLDLVK